MKISREKFIRDFFTQFMESDFTAPETRRCLSETLDKRLTDFDAEEKRDREWVRFDEAAVVKEGMIRQSLNNPNERVSINYKKKDPNPVAKG